MLPPEREEEVKVRNVDGVWSRAVICVVSGPRYGRGDRCAVSRELGELAAAIGLHLGYAVGGRVHS